MDTSQEATRRDDVLFHFANENEVTDLTGAVILRPGEMVLDIPGGYGPYSITGRAVGHRFEGSNSARRSYETDARWADVGEGLYVGVWIEKGEEFLFSFELRV